MKLLRLHLRNYRGVDDCQVTLPEVGVTIVEGPNEIGKSSLPEALDLLITYPDSSGHKSVKAVQPVGRDVGAEVEAELRTGPYRFVYRKRWHKARETSLHVLEPRPEQLSGKAAHDRVEAILAETLDKDLWDALRIEQDQTLTPASFGAGALAAALERAAGGDRTDDRDDALFARIEQERLRYWTRTGQVNTDRSALAAAVEAATKRVRAAEDQLADIEAAAEEAGRLEREAERLAEQAADQGARLGELEAQVAATAELRRAAELAEAEADRARLADDAARRLVEDRLRLVEQAQAAADALAALVTERERAASTRDLAHEQHQRAIEELVRAREQLASAEAAHSQAVADRDHARRLIELEQFTERLEHVTSAQVERSAAQQVLDTVRVDDQDLAAIEHAHLALVRVQAEAGSAAPRVEVTGAAAVTLSVDGETASFTPGETRTYTATAPLTVSLPDQVTVTVHPGSGSEELAHKVAAATAELTARCAAVGVDDLAGARTAHQLRADALATLARTEAEIARELRDLTETDLADKIAGHRQRIADHRAALPADHPVPDDLPDAQRREAEADAARIAARDRLAEAERSLESAQAAKSDLDVAEAAMVARIGDAQTAATETAGRLQEARQLASDQELTDAAAAATIRFEQADASLAEATLRLDAADPASLDALLDNAREAHRRAVLARDTNAERRRDLRIELELKGEMGLAQEVDAARTELDHLTRRHRAQEARAEAARLLADTFARRRAEARQRYVAPFRERIQTLGRLVYGPDFGVELSEDLAITSRTVDGITVAFDQLSTGAQEQLGILSRLACAALVDAEDGVPVIIDDALGWTDPDRLHGMGAAIASAGATSQIIVLTCTPGRYASVGSATVIQLPLTASAAGSDTAPDA